MSYTICKIKNISGSVQNIIKEWAIGEEYQVPDNLRIKYATFDAILVAISNGVLQVGDGSSYFSPVSTQLDWLKQTKSFVEVESANPFAAKTLPDGSKLYRRVHGVTATLTANGNTVVNFAVPYAKCKINACEIICPIDGVKADFEVYYGTTKLNQFGFDCNINKGFYKDESPYDADLTNALTVRATLKNSSSETPVVGINFILHEVVAV